MGMISQWIDQAMAPRFRKDASGRSVFVPFGPRKDGYYVDTASDEQKLRAFVKLHTVAAALMNLMGSIGSLAFAQALMFDRNYSAPLARQLEKFLAVYVIAVLVLYILPALALWKSYRGLIPELCASLTTVGPEQIRQMEQASPPFRRRLIIVAVGLMLVGLAVAVAATMYVARCSQ
jgi:branched-subunit amino acid transport protein AzlD